MKLELFDKAASVVIVLSIIFSLVVAVASWNWFPTPGHWGYIAQIPQYLLNYLALLLPPSVILFYLLFRRLYFKKEF